MPACSAKRGIKRALTCGATRSEFRLFITKIRLMGFLSMLLELHCPAKCPRKRNFTQKAHLYVCICDVLFGRRKLRAVRKHMEIHSCKDSNYMHFEDVEEDMRAKVGKDTMDEIASIILLQYMVGRKL